MRACRCCQGEAPKAHSGTWWIRYSYHDDLSRCVSPFAAVRSIVISGIDFGYGVLSRVEAVAIRDVVLYLVGLTGRTSRGILPCSKADQWIYPVLVFQELPKKMLSMFEV